MPREPEKYQLLLVEGNNDLHVICNLRDKHQLPKTFDVKVSNPEGIDALLTSLPVKLKEENLRTLGIVVDADQELYKQWEKVRKQLNSSGYKDIPDFPPAEGWVYIPSESSELKRLGVWLMPNNQLPGILEDFVTHLIPPSDNLRTKVEEVLQEIEDNGLNLYKIPDRTKALIYTWLAWQKHPGTPMGRAIAQRVLSHDLPLALMFVKWLQHLFELSTRQVS